jgi:hypothetical protein
MTATSAPAGSEFDFVDAPPEQPRDRWGLIVTKPDAATRAEAVVEAKVTMFRDRSRFFVTYRSGEQEILSSAQFVAFILELKRSGRFTFDRRRPKAKAKPA